MSFPVDVAHVLRPGVMISNAWPQSRTTAGETAQAIAAVLKQHPFFECFQTVDVPTAGERRDVHRLLGSHRRPLTYTLTRVLAERELNLSSLDTANRSAACRVAIERLEHAAEAGASSMCIISGPRPTGAGARADALLALEDSLAQLCIAARTHTPAIEIVIEPLDYEAHKRNTLGSTSEAVQICRQMARRGLELKLCLDTAHLILNDELIVEAVRLARDHVAEFHFCNCCVDRKHPLFGDRHLPFGPPGVVDIGQISVWMAELFRRGFFQREARPRVFCEVWKPDDMDPLAVVAHCEEALKQGWRRAIGAYA